MSKPLGRAHLIQQNIRATRLVRGLVDGLRARFAEAYTQVRDGAAQSFTGLAEALRGADFSTVDAANAQVRQQERDLEKTQEIERQQERGRGYGMER